MTGGEAGWGASRAPKVSRPLDWVLTRVCAALAEAMAELEAEAERLDAKDEEVSEALGEARRRLKTYGALYDRWGWVPVYGRYVWHKVHSAKVAFSSLKAEISSLRHKANDVRRRLTKASISYDMLVVLGQREYCVPDPMPERTQRFLRRFERVQKEGTLQENVYHLAGDLSEILGDWAAASLLFLQAQKKTVSSSDETEIKESSLVYDKSKGMFVESSGGYVKPVAHSQVLHRIYLPIPRNWEARAVQAGARIDESTVAHVMSRVWVSFHEYEDFEEYLPKSYRKVPPELDFEELHIRFGGQEFRFDHRQEAAIEKHMAVRQGWRCILCGSYGGLVWDWVSDPKHSAASKPLVLRPQWQYRRYGDTNIGVAELADVLLICRDCDLAFDIERLRGMLVGKSEKLIERAMTHVHKRRMMLLRCEDGGLSLRQAALAAHFGRMASLTGWVLDFSGWSERLEPLRDGVVAPETIPIAGIPILSSSGEVLVEETPLEQVVRRLTANGGAATSAAPSIHPAPDMLGSEWAATPSQGGDAPVAPLSP